MKRVSTSATEKASKKSKTAVAEEIAAKTKASPELHAFLQKQLEGKGVLSTIQVMYLPKGREGEPGTADNEIWIDCALEDGKWTITGACDWGQCEKGKPKEFEAKDVPASFWKGVLGFEYERHDQQTWPCNGVHNVHFFDPNKYKFAPEFHGFLLKQLEGKDVVSPICVEYLPEGREKVPETGYNEIHIKCEWRGKKWYIMNAWDWGQCEIQRLAEANANGFSKKLEAKDVPESFWKGVLGFVYESHEQDPCSVRFTKKNNYIYDARALRTLVTTI